MKWVDLSFVVRDIICSLLDEPNPNDPLVPEIADLLINNKSLHDENARAYTMKYATEFCD